jgi:hypothetical protein
MRVLGRLLRRGQRVLVTPHAVVQQGARPLRLSESHPHPPRQQLASASFDLPRRLILAATEGIQRESAARAGAAGGLGERVRLSVERCGCGQLFREYRHFRARDQRERKHR